MEKIDIIIVFVVVLLVSGLLYEHHVVDVARAENALEYCEELGYKSYLGYRGFIFNETPVAVRCTSPQQDVHIKQESTKSYREGYL